MVLRLLNVRNCQMIYIWQKYKAQTYTIISRAINFMENLLLVESICLEKIAMWISWLMEKGVTLMNGSGDGSIC